MGSTALAGIIGNRADALVEQLSPIFGIKFTLTVFESIILTIGIVIPLILIVIKNQQVINQSRKIKSFYDDYLKLLLQHNSQPDEESLRNILYAFLSNLMTLFSCLKSGSIFIPNPTKPGFLKLVASCNIATEYTEYFARYEFNHDSSNLAEKGVAGEAYSSKENIEVNIFKVKTPDGRYNIYGVPHMTLIDSLLRIQPNTLVMTL